MPTFEDYFAEMQRVVSNAQRQELWKFRRRIEAAQFSHSARIGQLIEQEANRLAQEIYNAIFAQVQGAVSGVLMTAAETKARLAGALVGASAAQTHAAYAKVMRTTLYESVSAIGIFLRRLVGEMLTNVPRNLQLSFAQESTLPGDLTLRAGGGRWTELAPATLRSKKYRCLEARKKAYCRGGLITQIGKIAAQAQRSAQALRLSAENIKRYTSMRAFWKAVTALKSDIDRIWTGAGGIKIEPAERGVAVTVLPTHLPMGGRVGPLELVLARAELSEYAKQSLRFTVRVVWRVVKRGAAWARFSWFHFGRPAIPGRSGSQPPRPFTFVTSGDENKASTVAFYGLARALEEIFQKQTGESEKVVKRLAWSAANFIWTQVSAAAKLAVEAARLARRPAVSPRAFEAIRTAMSRARELGVIFEGE